MAVVKIAVALLIVTPLLQVLAVYAHPSPAPAATVYTVGDSSGWTSLGNVDYKQWAATKNFKVGDIIVFRYNTQFHNVMQVTHAMYKSCNASTPLAAYSTGNDSITIKTHGHHFFMCGTPGHCQAGQKVDINVPRLDQELTTPSPSPSSPSSSSSSSPSVPAARNPSPNSLNSAISLNPFNAPFGNFSLAFALLLVSYVQFFSILGY